MSENKLAELSVFFPFYNEEANIAGQTKDALEHIPQFAENYEIILVNDGSADDTEEIGRRLADKHPQVRLVSYETNKGYGGALKSGFAAAQYDWVFFADGDRQFDLQELGKLVARSNQADLVIGYRHNRADTFIRTLNAKLFNLLIRILFGLKVRDIDCAFKLIKKDVLDSLQLKSDGAMISAELLIKAKKEGYQILEVPVEHFPRQVGESTGADPKVIFKAFYDIAALWKELK